MSKAEFPVASLPAPGRMHVDWEERVDFRRLHEYRLKRTRDAITNAGLGAVLVFDMNNIRYITSTHIGEWARDKVARFALLTPKGEPILWDFGSAAKVHRLHAPWLRPENSRAGMTGLRGSVAPEAGLSDDLARTVKEIMQEQGVAGEPLGVDIAELPMIFALQKCGINVVDGQQAMLDARQIKSKDEITLLTMAAAMVDGVYQTIFEALKPGIRENELVAIANKQLYDMGSDDVEAINILTCFRTA
jgi:Xaa-Pro aminopeptidase